MRVLWPLLLLAVGIVLIVAGGYPFDVSEATWIQGVVMLAGLALVLREICHLYRLSQPGSVDLAPFENATGDDKLEAQALAARVGLRLGALNVFRAPTLPSGSLDGLFVDVVASVPAAHAKWLSALMGLLARLARPRVGHRVTAIALRGEQAPACGLTATVADATTGKVAGVFTVWRDSYAVAADELAYLVYQAVSRSAPIRRRTPAWARFEAPRARSLVSFQHGLDAEERGDMERAHDLYHAALEVEPANVLIQMRAGNSEELVAIKGVDTQFARTLGGAEHYARAKRLWPWLVDPAYRLAVSYGFLALQDPDDHVDKASRPNQERLDSHITRLELAPRRHELDAIALRHEIAKAHADDYAQLQSRVRVLLGLESDADLARYDLRDRFLTEACDALTELRASLRYRVQWRRWLSVLVQDVKSSLKRYRGGSGQRRYYRGMLVPWPGGIKRRRLKCEVSLALDCAELRRLVSCTAHADLKEHRQNMERKVFRRPWWRRIACWGEVGWRAHYNAASYYGICVHPPPAASGNTEREKWARESDMYVSLALDGLRSVIVANRLNMRWLRRDPDFEYVRQHPKFRELFSLKSFDGQPSVFPDLEPFAKFAAQQWAERHESMKRWSALSMPELHRWVRQEHQAWRSLREWTVSPEDVELRALLGVTVAVPADVSSAASDRGHPSVLLGQCNDGLAALADSLGTTWSARERHCNETLLKGASVSRDRAARWAAEAELQWHALADWAGDPLEEGKQAVFAACVSQSNPDDATTSPELDR